MEGQILMPHVFDHTPTAQEVFDEACRYFATTKGPSIVVRSHGENCRYRAPETGRTCIAGHFIPDENYVPAMDGLTLIDNYVGGGTGIENIVEYLGDKLPAWFRDRLPLLKRLQGIHDANTGWTADYRWDYAPLAHQLTLLAASLKLDDTAANQVRALIPTQRVPVGWRSVEA
jgi:hypothetical protein